MKATMKAIGFRETEIPSKLLLLVNPLARKKGA
jgi:hypothetical protein